MLQQKKPDDFVVSTGEHHSVEEFAKLAFQEVELDYKKFIETNKKLIRPAEVDTLVGDCKKAKKQLNWKPKISFRKLVSEMVREDLQYVKKFRI